MSNTLSVAADGAFREPNPTAAAATAPAQSRDESRKAEPLLPRIAGHADLAALDRARLPEVAEEIRELILDVVCKNGGHLGSNFGVVELSIALHYVYDFSNDVIVWDVGHQCYPHKLLTGRAARFHTLRSKEGVSGYPHPEESPYDVMRSGHAGTAISMGLGIAAADGLEANRIAHGDRDVVAVVGDSGLGAGVALEALNYAAHIGRDIVVVLNDNEMSISQTVGSLASYLNRLRAAPIYTGAKERFHALLRSIPFGQKIDKNLVDMVDAVKAAIAPGHLFEELGFRYYGPIDGHDIDLMIDQFSAIRRVPGVKLMHVVTKKGKGLEPTGKDTRYLHGVNPGTKLPGFGAAPPVVCATDKKEAPAAAVKKARSFTEVFGDAMCALAEKDPRVVAITAAMPEGTGLVEFSKRFPDRFHDTGITEQHAVAFAGGLAKGGAKPVAAIYSTFLQRGYDQVFQEAVLQDLPVVFALDRGGLVGQDGPSHNGCYDIAYLRTFPNLVFASPRDGGELRAMLELAIDQKHPFALRYPRGNGADPEIPSQRPLEVGKSEVLRDGKDVAIVAFGPLAYDALVAADKLNAKGVDAAVINARFVKPIDTDLLDAYASKVKLLVTLEEHQVMGGFGSAVLEALALRGKNAGKVLPIGIPDRLIEHALRNECLEDAGLTPDQIVATIMGRLARL